MDARRVTQLTRELGDEHLADLLVAAHGEVVRPVDERMATRHLLAMREEIDAHHRASTDRRFAGTGAAVAVGQGLRLGLTTAAAVFVLAVGLASTNTLPAFAQTFVADVGKLVGLAFPRPATVDLETVPGGPGTGGTAGQPPADAVRVPGAPNREAVVPTGQDGAADATDREPGRGQMQRDEVPAGSRRDTVPRQEPRPVPDGSGRDTTPKTGSRPTQEVDLGPSGPAVAPPSGAQDPVPPDPANTTPTDTAPADAAEPGDPGIPTAPPDPVRPGRAAPPGPRGMESPAVGEAPDSLAVSPMQSVPAGPATQGGGSSSGFARTFPPAS